MIELEDTFATPIIKVSENKSCNFGRQAHAYVFTDKDNAKRLIADFKNLLNIFEQNSLVEINRMEFNNIADTGLLKIVKDQQTGNFDFHLFDFIRDYFNAEIIPFSSLEDWLTTQSQPSLKNTIGFQINME